MTKPKAIKPKKKLEPKVKGELRKLFAKYNVLFTPISGTQFGKKGFPDYICYAENFTHFVVEAKSTVGKLSDDQITWRDNLIARGVKHFTFNSLTNELEDFLKQTRLCQQ